MELFYRPFTELVTFGKPFDLQILQPWELAVLGYLLVLFIVSAAAHCIIAGFEAKIRTRAYLQFLIDLNIFLPAHSFAANLLCQSVAIAHDKQQHPDRTFFRTDQQQDIERVLLHNLAGQSHPPIQF